jgi:quercetin dioxygenase-like cupin family protein
MTLENSHVFDVAPIHDVSMDGVYFQIFHANKGEGVAKHQHSYSHAVICNAGKIMVSKEGIKLEMDKTTQPILLKSDGWHEIEAIEDGTVFINVFAQK